MVLILLTRKLSCDRKKMAVELNKCLNAQKSKVARVSLPTFEHSTVDTFYGFGHLRFFIIFACGSQRS
jgi:hypothetical protein